MWEGRKNLENAKELVEEFESVCREAAKEARQQKQIEEEKEFSRVLPGKYIAKLVYSWGNRKYKRERERRWEENCTQWKHSLGQGILRGGLCYGLESNPNLLPAFKGLINNHINL